MNNHAHNGVDLSMFEAHPEEPIDYLMDIPYAATDNPRQRLDLYVPRSQASKSLPVLVGIHGGAWQHGDKAGGAGALAPFVRTGAYAGVSIGYRLTNEAIWPAQLQDCKAAIRWIHAHAAELGLNAQRIAAWGGSAGGQLALMLGFTANMSNLEGDLGRHASVSSRISAVVNLFAPTDLLALIDSKSEIDRTDPQSPEALLLGGPLQDNPEKARAASPITYVHSGAPPVLTVHGDADPLIPYDQALRLNEALKFAGVPNPLITVIGGAHGGFPDEVMERVATFLSRELLGQDVALSTEPVTQVSSAQ